MAQQQEQPSKVETWSYPFPLKTTNTSVAPEDYLKALAVAEDGFYPLGANGLWHGGIHFGAQTAGKFEQDGGVKCIADGEVVAFRLDKQLQEVAYPGGIKAGYSKGFTLVRHRLVLPAAPAPQAGGNAQPQSQNTTPSADDVLTFFSLYMHTLPFGGYSSTSQSNAPKKTLPAYYGASVTYSVGTSASDPQLKATGEPDNATKGLRVRASHSAHADAIAWLPQGTKITIGQKHGKWGKISGFVTGAAQPYTQGGSLPPSAAHGWVYTGEMVEETAPSAIDQIYILPTPHKISAGETVAWIGEYQRLAEARAHNTLPPKLGERPLLHVEVFSGDDLNAFIARSRQRAQQLDAKSRTLLLIEKGAKLVQPASADTSIPHATLVKDAPGSPGSGPWRKVLQVNASGHPISNQTLWIAREDPHGNDARPAWSQFPLQVQSANSQPAAWLRVVSTSSAQACAEAANKTWYQVSIADSNDEEVNGWVCDHGHALVELKSPWDWPGFDLVSLDASVSVMFERALYAADSGSPDEIARFEDSFDAARSDELIKKLEDAIDAQGQKDGKITASELQSALRKPWLADRIDHLIVRYESEWGGEMSKWDTIDSHMHAGLPVWGAEKTRIASLRFWSQISGVGGWPALTKVFHIHPVGLVGNFKVSGELITMEMLIAAEPGNSRSYYQGILPAMNEFARVYRVNTPKRIAHFLSQCGHESGLRIAEEGLDFNPQNMRKTFGCKGGKKNYNAACDDCTHGRLREKLWSQEATYAHHPENLGNFVYADRMGNGSESSGEGYKYRGRGIMQITGKTGYRSFTEGHNARSPQDHQDFVATPELVVSNPRYAVESAFFFWSNNNLNAVADSGHVVDVTQIVNGGQNGYTDRLTRFNRIAPLVGISGE